MIFVLLLLYIFQEISCENVISAEKRNNMQNERADKNTARVETSPRRFIDDLNDEEWHVSHLKDLREETDLRRKDSECVEEPVLSRYRKALRNDGALVEYVSADAMIPDENELLQSNKCAPKSHGLKVKSNVEAKSTDSKPTNLPNDDKLTKDTNAVKNKVTPTRAEELNDTVAEPVNTATTNKNNVETKNTTSQRRSDYQFSSVEYYDDVIDFDEASCPDAVQVIELEIDQLRSYDVECEAMIEWRSLDNV